MDEISADSRGKVRCKTIARQSPLAVAILTEQSSHYSHLSADELCLQGRQLQSEVSFSHLRRMTVASANPRPIEAEFDRNFYWSGFSFDCMSQSMIRASLHVYLREICGDISDHERVTDFIDNNRLIGLEVLVNNLCQIDYHRLWVNLWSIIGVYIRSERKRNGTRRQVRKYLLFVINPPFHLLPNVKLSNEMMIWDKIVRYRWKMKISLSTPIHVEFDDANYTCSLVLWHGKRSYIDVIYSGFPQNLM